MQKQMNACLFAPKLVLSLPPILRFERPHDSTARISFQPYVHVHLHHEHAMQTAMKLCMYHCLCSEWC